MSGPRILRMTTANFVSNNGRPRSVMPSSTRAAQKKRSDVAHVVNFSRLSQKEDAARAKLSKRLEMKDIDDVSSTSSEMG